MLFTIVFRSDQPVEAIDSWCVVILSHHSLLICKESGGGMDSEHASLRQNAVIMVESEFLLVRRDGRCGVNVAGVQVPVESKL